MKAIITPRNGLHVADYWYVPFAGMEVDVEPSKQLSEGDVYWYIVTSKPLCDAQNIDPYIHVADLNLLEETTDAPTQT